MGGGPWNHLRVVDTNRNCGDDSEIRRVTDAASLEGCRGETNIGGTMRVRRSLVLLCGAFVLAAAACTPPATGPTNQSPISSFTASPTSGNATLVVTFDGTASTDADGTIATYAWTFGDGGVDSGSVVTHSYVGGGTFVATLTVTDNGSATNSISKTITVTGDGDADGYFPPSDCDDTNAAINPGATDVAGDGIDQNCDGIDGTVSNAIFVSSLTGSDTLSCGGIGAPCGSITQGISRAGIDGDTEVYVAGGTYSKFSVVAGISVRGGYGQNWARGLLAQGSTTAIVNASFDASVGGPVAIVASGISVATGISDLTVLGTTAGSGQASYGVIVHNSTGALTFDTINITGGAAGAGSAGSAGASATQTPAAAGSNGSGGFEPGGVCNSSSAGAGGAGAAGAGAGGKGGTIDTDCGAFSLNLDSTNGATGGAAGGSGGAGGSAENTALFCGGGAIQTNAGNGGNGVAGSAGSNGNGGAAAVGSFNGTVWAPAAVAAGSTGTVGANGTGGGGGGGGGASDCNTDDAGAGGGGGGAGGLKATSAGTGGGAGAASIALLLDNASPTLTAVQITLGYGGNGGSGGAAALGQPGGAGGAGGAGFERGGTGGTGGAGGKGGNSGAGGGGAGGPALGLARHGASTPVGTPAFSGGTGGNGGSGVLAGAPGSVVNNTTI